MNSSCSCHSLFPSVKWDGEKGSWYCPPPLCVTPSEDLSSPLSFPVGTVLLELVGKFSVPSGGCSWNSIISDKPLGGLRWSQDEESWDSCPDLSPLPVTRVPLSHTQASTHFSLLSLSLFPSSFLPSVLSPLFFCFLQLCLHPSLISSLVPSKALGTWRYRWSAPPQVHGAQGTFLPTETHQVHP